MDVRAGVAASPGTDAPEPWERTDGGSWRSSFRPLRGFRSAWTFPLEGALTSLLRKDQCAMRRQARPLQEKSIPRPRRLPAASGLVQARVGPDVGGDRPSNRGRSRHRQAVVEEGSASQLSASESAPRPGRKRGTRPPVRRLRGRGAGQPPGRPVPGHRPAETQKGPHTSVSGGGGRTPGDPLPRISAVSVPRRPARPLEQPQRLLLGLG